MSDNEFLVLRQKALEMRERAYCPYSKFPVGAALLGADGRIFTGCNIENSSYSLGICAERTAVARAVADGCRDFAAIAIAGSGSGPIVPCGACLQVMAEFAPDLKIILVHDNTKYLCYSLKDLLPCAFKLEI